MKHYCHDPFCTRNMVKNNHRKYVRSGKKRNIKSPRCTAAIQEFDHSVGGIHPWKRCAWRVGPHGDLKAMRCAIHKPGAPGAAHPDFNKV